MLKIIFDDVIRSSMACCGCLHFLRGSDDPKSKRGRVLSEFSLDSIRRTRDFRLDLNFIGQVPLFKSLPLSDHPIVAAALQSRSYESGSLVTTQGDIGEDLFVIKEGKAKVVTDGEVVSVLESGSHFGAEALRGVGKA